VISVHVPERRLHPRQRVPSHVFVDLGEGKRSTVLNVGEGGLALQVPVTLADHPHIPPLRFGLAISENSIEINGQIAWVSEPTKETDINLQEDTRRKIRDWISLESSQARFPTETRADRGNTNP
jgi:hypothetical protein